MPIRNRTVGNGNGGKATIDRDPRKLAAFDRAVANKMGLAGWILHGSRRPDEDTAAQQAAAKENNARAAMQARNLPKAQRLVGEAIGQRMQALSPRGQQQLQREARASQTAKAGSQASGEPRDDPAVRPHLRRHQRAVGYLRGVQQAMGDVASAYFHEARKIDGNWPKKRK